jgi:hypothetical protein
MMDDANAAQKSRWRWSASVVIAIMMGFLFVYGLVRFPAISL